MSWLLSHFFRDLWQFIDRTYIAVSSQGLEVSVIFSLVLFRIVSREGVTHIILSLIDIIKLFVSLVLSVSLFRFILKLICCLHFLFLWVTNHKIIIVNLFSFFVLSNLWSLIILLVISLLIHWIFVSFSLRLIPFGRLIVSVLIFLFRRSFHFRLSLFVTSDYIFNM